MNRPVRRVFRTGLIVGLAVFICACAVREQRPKGTWVEQRESWFAAHPVWSVSGRAALREGQRGGQLAFDWQAQGDRHRIHLRTVTGGRQWVLEFEPGYAELEGTDVGRIAGPDPNELVEAAVGWPIPVVELADWIRGLVRPEHARVEYSRDGTLRRVSLAPWELDYHRFEEIDGQLMPVSMEAESPPYRVRVVLRGWLWEASELPEV
jgi:outer membrane lipoprotein LolB